MHERLDNEPGERGRRRLTTRSVIALACIIAIAGAIGLVISFGQRPAAQITHPAPTPSSLQPITPSPVPGQPQAGQGVSIAADVATHEIVLFGGVGDYPNTWVWDGAQWTLAHPPASPEGRFGASEAYDPRTKTVLLFGGRLEPGTPVNDTWAWNGTTWGELDAGVEFAPARRGLRHGLGPRPVADGAAHPVGGHLGARGNLDLVGDALDTIRGRAAPRRGDVQPDVVRPREPVAACGWVLRRPASFHRGGQHHVAVEWRQLDAAAILRRRAFRGVDDGTGPTHRPPRALRVRCTSGLEPTALGVGRRRLGFAPVRSGAGDDRDGDHRLRSG